MVMQCGRSARNSCIEKVAFFAILFPVFFFFLPFSSLTPAVPLHLASRVPGLRFLALHLLSLASP